MGSIRETHLGLVQALRDRGEEVLQPKYGNPMGSIRGYIKTQIPYKDAGAIFEDKNGKFGLFGDMGALHVTGIEWCDLGLCDARCWYEWMDPEFYQEEVLEGEDRMIIPNKRVWEVGDIVIHEDDKKIESMLMRVIDVLNSGLAKTVYIHPKGNVVFYQYYIESLHDPRKFGMISTISFFQELEQRIENITKFITSLNGDVDEIRYSRGQISGIRIAFEIYRDLQK